MPFDVSFGLVSTVIQLSAETHEALGHFQRTNATISGLLQVVPAAGEAFGRLEEDDLGLLEEKEREKLGDITRALIDSFNAILPILKTIMHKRTTTAYLFPKKELVVPTRFTSLMAEKRQAITSCVSVLNRLLLNFERRQGKVAKPLPSSFVSYGGSQSRKAFFFLGSEPRPSTILRDFKREWLAIFGSFLNLVFTRPRSCILIMLFFAAFVGLSCFLGVYFTLNKSYGYSMGDAFTLAGYVIAVGAFISSAILAYHRPRCKCWDSSVHHQASRHDDYELQTLVELPG